MADLDQERIRTLRAARLVLWLLAWYLLVPLFALVLGALVLAIGSLSGGIEW